MSINKRIRRALKWFGASKNGIEISNTDIRTANKQLAEYEKERIKLASIFRRKRRLK